MYYVIMLVYNEIYVIFHLIYMFGITIIYCICGTENVNYLQG